MQRISAEAYRVRAVASVDRADCGPEKGEPERRANGGFRGSQGRRGRDYDGHAPGDDSGEVLFAANPPGGPASRVRGCRALPGRPQISVLLSRFGRQRGSSGYGSLTELRRTSPQRPGLAGGARVTAFSIARESDRK